MDVPVNTDKSLADAFIKASTSVFFHWLPTPGRPVDYVSGNISQFGYEASDFLSSGKRYEEIVHPDDLSGVREQVRAFSARPTSSFNLSYRLVAPVGEIFWVEDRTVIEWSDSGEIAGYLGIINDVTREKRAAAALRESESRFRALVEATSDFIWKVDQHGFYIYCSPRVKQILGYEPEELLGKTPFEFMSQQEAERVEQEFGRFAQNGEAFSALENTNRHKDGHTVVLETSAVPYFSEKGTLLGYRGIDRDISERKRAELRLREQSDFLQSVIDGVKDPILVIGTDYRVKLMNHAVQNNLRSELIEDPASPKCYEVSHHRSSPCSGEEHPCPLAEVMQTRKHTTVLHRHAGRDDTIRHVELVVSPLWNVDGTLDGIIESSRDITEHLEVQAELERSQVNLAYQAHHDSLTNLPNRPLFLDRLDQAIKNASRSGESLAILFLDLDRFKQINDSLGHAVGDEVLKVLARLLQQCVREEDTVARLGGDEFTLIMKSLNKPRDAAVLAQKLRHVLQQPVFVDDHELYVTASIGISIYPQDGDTATVLLRNADSAMYRAKEDGRDTFEFYTTDMTEQAFQHVLMEASMRRGLERGEFVLFYQPQEAVSTGRLVGVEALVRWQQPELGLISPVDFIPLAEDTGLIFPLGEWVIRAACTQMKSWQDANVGVDRVSINLSVKQLYKTDLVTTLQQILEETGCRPEWLELEITESCMMERPEQSIAVLRELRMLGIQLSIDDFGTGYSSLVYLKRLPVTKLKIDQSFVRDVPEIADDMAIARAVIALGNSLNLKVLAEGVETEIQKSFLVDEGCEEIQGYLVSRPLPADELGTLLKNRY